MSSRAMQVRPLDIFIAISIVAVLAFGIAWNPTNAANGPTGLVTVNPTRVHDTRTGAKPAAGSVIDVDTGHRGASAVVANITTVDAAASGYVTAWAAGPRPDASILNYTARQTIANSVIVPVDAGGKFQLFTLASAHLLVDISGYFDGGTALPPGGITSAITGYVPVPDAELNSDGTIVIGTVSNGTIEDFGWMRVEVICPDGSLRMDRIDLDTLEGDQGFEVACPGFWEAGATIRAVVDL